MATTVKRGKVYRTSIRLSGMSQPVTMTHATKAEGKVWGMQEEKRLRGRLKLSGLSFGDVIRAYIVSKCKDPAKARNATQLRRFATEFDRTAIKDMTCKWWEETALAWPNLTPFSRMTYMQRLRMVMKWAKNGPDKVQFDWDAVKEATGYLLANKDITTKARKRERRASDNELARLKACSNNTKYPIGDVIEFGVLTGLRIGEICKLKWADFYQTKRGPMITVHDRKDPHNQDGNDGEIPLLGNAAAIVQRQPKGDARIFPFDPNAFGNAYRAVRHRAGIKNLRVHDLRHEAITRLFEQGYSIEEVSDISGHKDWETLKHYRIGDSSRLHDGPIANMLAAQGRKRVA